MPSIAYYFLLTTLLCLPPLLHAKTVHRCEAANGHVTFTTLSCTAGESLSLQDVRTFTPGRLTSPPGQAVVSTDNRILLLRLAKRFRMIVLR